MSAGDNFRTPEWLAKLLGSFEIDPCSNTGSHIVAQRTCSLEGDTPNCIGTNGLACDWEDWLAYLNWPYGNPLPWARKVTEHPGPWVVLAKLDPTTRWWAELMRSMPTVAPFRKRIKFEGEPNMTANFPSVLVYSAWRPSAELREHLWLPSYARAA